MASDLESLLAAGEREVFHGPPKAAIGRLQQAVETARPEGRVAEATAAAWLLGVALSACGQYGRSLSVLMPLLEAGENSGAAPETVLFSALAAATAASVHRGLGRHQGAHELDARGLALTDGSGVAGFDCLLGLASDAVGMGDIPQAKVRVVGAEAVAGGHGEDWWRQRVRLGWVRAEIALLDGEPEQAVRLAAASVALAERSRAPRHVAKGLLFQAVAEVSAGADSAAATLRRAATLAEQTGALPLVWHARALLGALLAQTDPAAAEQSLDVARSAIGEMAEDLPEPLRGEWLARPDVRAVLDA